ncbi:MAG: AmmeMemoRadiSam system protein B [Spirochaetes bacterium]|nr:AmmeMemoRadiSam system protein B [Spirochaetota bacterium]
MNKRRPVLFIMMFLLSCGLVDSEAKVKTSNLAGSWYPSDAGQLKEQIDTLLAGAQPRRIDREPLALIMPHAGYVYSGKTAAQGYRIIGAAGKPAIASRLIVILGPSHYSAFRGCSLLEAEYYETPLGKVKLNREAAEILAGDGLFRKNTTAFEREHSIEIHLPYLQRIFGNRLRKDVQVLPVLVGDLDDADAKKAAARLAEATARSDPFFIISTDFTHYGPNFGYEPFKNAGGQSTSARIKGLDDGAIDLIIKKDIAGFTGYCEKTGATICGRNPIRIALALPIGGFRAEKIAYDTSGRVTGDYANSVSYASILLSGRLEASRFGDREEALLSDKDRQFLLRAARDNIASWLKKRRGIQIFPTDAPPALLEKRGVFVTLKKHGRLRGCIGYLTGIKPLILAVLDNSYNAAFEDPRFGPVTEDELPAITIEISVLTEPVRVKSVDEIKVGRDGLIIERGFYRGLLLPQVPVEQGWDRRAFLDGTCQKAGLPSNAWKDKETKISRFQAVVFGEEKQ